MYYEYAHNVKDRGKIVSQEKLPALIKDSRDKGLELYLSTYLYDDELLEHMKAFRTVKSYKGIYHLPSIILDIDNHTTTKKEKLDEVLFLSFFKEKLDELITTFKIDEDLIQIWFSGRGYHVILPDIFEILIPPISPVTKERPS
jgi:hypothetical protein